RPQSLALRPQRLEIPCATHWRHATFGHCALTSTMSNAVRHGRQRPDQKGRTPTQPARTAGWPPGVVSLAHHSRAHVTVAHSDRVRGEVGMTMYARSREAALSIPLLVVLASACATGIAQQGVLGFDAAADVTPMKRASSATLTSSDLAIPNTMSTLSVIRRLRPEFLIGSGRRATIGKPEIALYVDDIYKGEPSLIDSIPLEAILEIAFLQPNDGQMRYGLNCRCRNGVILVRTRRPDSPRIAAQLAYLTCTT